MSRGGSDEGLRSSSLLARQSIVAQHVTLSGSDASNSYPIYGRDVTITPSSVDDNAEGSNKVKISHITSYEWAVKHYKGQQVAVDKGHKYIAYALKGRSGGIVRLIYTKTSERALIKGYNGLVIDLAFAHSDSEVLASIDESSTLFVHKIELDSADHVITTKLMQLSWATGNPDMRVTWCCHIPDRNASDSDSEDDEDKSMLLSTIVANKVYVLDVEQLFNEHGAGPHQYAEIAGSIMEIDRHAGKVVSASFAPDGSAIATASEDGSACLFEMKNGSNTSRRLHVWEPHGGQPLSMLYFLDDLTNTDPSIAFWKYALTACNNNTEIKIWSCLKWQCLQTLRFMPRGEMRSSCLIANIDLSSKYLVLSDITHRVLYVLKIHHDKSSDIVHISSVSEFILGAPVLSFAIMDIRRKQVFNADSDDDDDEEEDDDMYSNGVDDERRYRKAISLHLRAVQPKHLQDMHITFTPLTAAATDSLQTSTGLTTSSVDSNPLHDARSDVSVSTSGTEPLLSATQLPSRHLPPNTSFELLAGDGLELLSSGLLPKVDSSASSVSTDPAVSLSKPVDSVGSSTDSVSLSQPPAAFQNQSTDEGSEGAADATLTNSIASAAARSSVLLTPDSFITAATAKPVTSLDTVLSPSGSARPGMDALHSPGSGRSSLTHVTQMPDNNSLIMAGFDAGTVSSVSPRTITPMSSVNGMSDLTSPLTQPAPLAALSPATELEPAPQSDEATARKLDELFSGVDENICSMSTGVLPTLPVSHMLTEEDILNDSPLDSLTRSLSLPNPPLDTSPLSLAPASAQPTYDVKIWPKPPDPPTQNSDSGETDERRLPQTKRDTSDDPSDQSATSSEVESVNEEEELNVKDIERDVEQEEANQARVVERPTHAMGAAVAAPPSDDSKQLMRKMQDLEAAMLTLNEQMMAQGRDIHVLKSSSSSEQRLNQLSKQVQQLSSTVTSKLEQTVASLKREQRTMQERQGSQATSKLNQELKSNLERVVSVEMKKSVLPALGQLIDPVKKDLHSVMAEKLTVGDKSFKEAVNKLFNSQAMIDKVAQSVVLAVQETMLSAHRDSLAHQVLPSFDAAMRQCFAQLNSSFAEGLNNYLKQMNDSMDRIKTKQMNTQSIITTSCEEAVESLKQTSKSVTKHLTTTLQKEIQLQVSQVLDSVRGQLVGDLKEVVRQEVSSALQGQQQALTEQIEAIRSAAATPAPEQMNTAAIKALIDRLVVMKDYEQAFQNALSASDLSLVMYLLCKLPDSSAVLIEPCPLGQPTLLSLIQQLSSGLSDSNLDLKFDYLADAILNLDPQETVTKEHMGRILGMVKEKLAEYLTKNPGTPHRRTILGIEKSVRSTLKYV